MTDGTGLSRLRYIARAGPSPEIIRKRPAECDPAGVTVLISPDAMHMPRAGRRPGPGSGWCKAPPSSSGSCWYWPVRPSLVITWPWFSAGFLLSLISQLITQLSHRHQWLAGHLHLAAQLSDWAEWAGLALMGIAVVLGIRSGELLFWKRSG